MAGLARSQRRLFEPWPAYVDVLSTLLMVVIFVLMVFVIAQFFLSDALSGRNKAHGLFLYREPGLHPEKRSGSGQVAQARKKKGEIGHAGLKNCPGLLDGVPQSLVEDSPPWHQVFFSVKRLFQHSAASVIEDSTVAQRPHTNVIECVRSGGAARPEPAFLRFILCYLGDEVPPRSPRGRANEIRPPCPAQGQESSRQLEQRQSRPSRL